MLLVAGLELLDGFLSVLYAARLARGQAREIAVQAHSAPVSMDQLGVEGRCSEGREACTPEVAT
jgi:hypothetical protein